MNQIVKEEFIMPNIFTFVGFYVTFLSLLWIAWFVAEGIYQLGLVEFIRWVFQGFPLEVNEKMYHVTNPITYDTVNGYVDAEGHRLEVTRMAIARAPKL